MAYQNDKQTQAEGPVEKTGPEEELSRETASFGLPNSLMQGMPLPPPGTPNSVMREMLDPRNPGPVAAGAHYGLPNSVQRQMDSAADPAYSSVRSQNGLQGVRESGTAGSAGVGFLPPSGTHELVHTVQRSAVHGAAGRSVPDGTIQRIPWFIQSFLDFFSGKKKSGAAGNAPQAEAGTASADAETLIPSAGTSADDTTVHVPVPVRAENKTEDESSAGGASEESADKEETKTDKNPTTPPPTPPAPTPPPATPPAGSPTAPDASGTSMKDGASTTDPDEVTDSETTPPVTPAATPDVVPDPSTTTTTTTTTTAASPKAEEDDEGDQNVRDARYKRETAGNAVKYHHRNRLFSRKSHLDIAGIAADYRRKFNIPQIPQDSADDQQAARDMDERLEEAADIMRPAMAAEIANEGRGEELPPGRTGTDYANDTGQVFQLVKNADSIVNGIVLSDRSDQSGASWTTDPKEMTDAFKSFKQTDFSAAGIAANAVGLPADIIKIITSGEQVGKDIANIRHGVGAADILEHSMDTAAGAGGYINDVLGIADKASTIADGASALGSAAPAASLALSSLNLYGGLWEANRGVSHWAQQHVNRRELEKMRAAQQAVGGDEDGVSPAMETGALAALSDQDKMERVADEAKHAAKLKTTRGVGKFVAGAVGAGSAAAALSGPLAPGVIAILAVATGAVAIVKFGLDQALKDTFHEDIITEEWGIRWNEEMDRVRKMIHDENPKMDLMDHEVREIILKAHGSGAKTRTQAFNAINQKRADYLLHKARNPGPYQKIAEGIIEGLGVHKRGGRFSDGAAKILAKKLGTG